MENVVFNSSLSDSNTGSLSYPARGSVRGVRVSVFGSSVALTIRPPRANRTEGTYSDRVDALALKAGFYLIVKNHAQRSRLITHENEMDFVGKLQKDNPDYVILHYGINEAAPRVWPYRLWMIAHAPKWGRSNLYYRLHRYLVSFESCVIRVFKKRGWVPEQRFESLLVSMITTIAKETRSRTIVVSICESNDYYKRALPGIVKQVERYNQLMSRICSRHNTYFVDMAELAREHGPEQICPDGAHLSSLGHKLIGDNIFSVITG